MLSIFFILIIGFSQNAVFSQMPSFTCSDVTYIRPDEGQRTWADAQNICRNLSATLPNADSPAHQKCFTEALVHFNADQAYSWMGARSSGGDPNGWQWLDGSPYTAAGSIFGASYLQSYASVTNDLNSGLTFYASNPSEKHPYICRYNNSGSPECSNGSIRTAFVRGSNCFVKYNLLMAWFSARNNCVSNKGDLASFPDTSVLSGIIDAGKWWIGLRSSSWNWTNNVSGTTTDVTFNQWSDGQPNGDGPQCMSTDGYGGVEYFNWRDYNCNDPEIFICQTSTVTMTSGRGDVGPENQISATRQQKTSSAVQTGTEKAASTPSTSFLSSKVTTINTDSSSKAITRPQQITTPTIQKVTAKTIYDRSTENHYHDDAQLTRLLRNQNSIVLTHIWTEQQRETCLQKAPTPVSDLQHSSS